METRDSEALAASAPLAWLAPEFGWFALKQVQAAAFPISVFALLALWKVAVHPLGIPLARYDFLLAGCLVIQAWLVWAKWETLDELKVIGVFHMIGLCLELYKVHHGSWFYPDPAFVKVWDVPLYSGFMYASVASYVTQAWRRFDLEMSHWPGLPATLASCVCIYANFFLSRWIGDYRWWIAAGVLVVFWKTKVHFTCREGRFTMPMLVAFALIGFFIWVAENFCTALGAWQYPNQVTGWQMVNWSKYSSWTLLAILSVTLIVWLKAVKAGRNAPSPPSLLSPASEERGSMPPVACPMGGWSKRWKR